MKRLLTVIACVTMGMLGAYLQNNNIAERAWAGITCTLPVTLQNNTTADANQVMQNFNQLVSCFTSVATVSQVTCGPGLDGGIITGTGTCSLSAARRTNPTFQSFTGAGTFTYTTPTNTLWMEAWLIGGGGGGGGSGLGGGAGGAGGDTCWGATGCTTPTYKAGGGTGAQGADGSGNGQNAGVGGTPTGACIIALHGNDGGQTLLSGGPTAGMPGGAGPYGGAKTGPRASSSTSNTATGSGGMGGFSTGFNNGSGGGAGAYCYAIVANPSASYSITIGAGGAAGAAGAQAVGVAGANGSLYVLEHYN